MYIEVHGTPVPFSMKIRKEKRWSVQPLPFRNPHWFFLIAWFAFSFNLFWMTRQKTFPGTLSTAMPLKLSHTSYAPFLYTGTTICFNQSFGTFSECQTLQDKHVNNWTTGSPPSFNISAVISSNPGALFHFSWLMASHISSWL